MADKKVLMTYEGIKELEEELATLKGKTRMEVSDRLKSAISFGDITENSEYDEAKNEQAQVEARISYLENLLMNAEVIDSDNLDMTIVSVGGRVKILDLEYNE
ncbi:MAG: transcription elongation factor GreA, partial [Clostridiaceae bacterium]|nr:transcription elongation factor GreA [Clostridiaceae bacterium]